MQLVILGSDVGRGPGLTLRSSPKNFDADWNRTAEYISGPGQDQLRTKHTRSNKEEPRVVYDIITEDRAVARPAAATDAQGDSGARRRSVYASNRTEENSKKSFSRMPRRHHSIF